MHECMKKSFFNVVENSKVSITHKNLGIKKKITIGIVYRMRILLKYLKENNDAL